MSSCFVEFADVSVYICFCIFCVLSMGLRVVVSCLNIRGFRVSSDFVSGVFCLLICQGVLLFV